MAVQIIYKPKNDDEFLEDVAQIVFIAGFRFDLVMKRWPLIRKAFFNFSIKKLSNYDNVDKLMKADGMIKNRGKIIAILENAKMCYEIQKKHGGILKWIDTLKKANKKDPLLSQPLNEAFIRFNRIGKITSGWLAGLHNSKGDYIEYDDGK
jgi:3-methyladenine DNA glycosylase Tag